MNRFVKLSFLLLISIVSSSCDYQNDLDYNVINTNNHPITLVYRYYKKDAPNHSSEDTTVNIPAYTKQKLFAGYVLGGYVYNSQGNTGNISAFTKLDCYKYDTVKYNNNYLDLGFWDYNRISKHHAEYNLDIKD